PVSEEADLGAWTWPAGKEGRKRLQKIFSVFVLQIRKSFLPLHPLPEGSFLKRPCNRGRRKGKGAERKGKKSLKIFP
ncbi:hypothetical protein ACMA1I_23330, partial [Pontibacter sp. 13R65]|uniref:hypothetical protein n=1 Tax=Pontibacter sp. 13R65 TaxID=3127458 RepID=UPI00301C53E3